MQRDVVRRLRQIFERVDDADAVAREFEGRVDRLEAEKDSIAGVIVTSAKKTFFAGGDLNELIKVTQAEARASTR